MLRYAFNFSFYFLFDMWLSIHFLEQFCLKVNKGQNRSVSNTNIKPREFEEKTNQLNH